MRMLDTVRLCSLLPALILAACTSLASGAPQVAPTRPGPSAATRTEHALIQAKLNFADTRDFEFARRGFIATRKDPLIRTTTGQPVWDLAAFNFLNGASSGSVNPSLWRQAQLMAQHGLFQVSERIWQVRGFDLANITFVKGDTGWIIIDTLGANETAKAALDLVTEQLGARPVRALIYTHSHTDHFGGAAGIVSLAEVRAGQIPVIAPKGFLPAAVGENVIAGPAMQRRAMYQFGLPLPKEASGLVNAGIGPGLSRGTSSLIPPTQEIAATGEQHLIDGVRMVFQLTPGTEAPAEMNISFPDWKVVDMAENANATQHNILTPRGAVVRDAKVWAEGLTAALRLFGDSEILITSHGWPRFGNAAIREYLAKHRDAYAYLHDQTVRLMNKGLNGDEIATQLELPDELAQEWYDRPYYGSLSFNSRAVYQFYMGWYDGNPANLAPSPPVETGRRYVDAMGGTERVKRLAAAAYEKGDYAWAAELLNHVVMTNGADTSAKELLARAYDQLGWQSENSLWRNIYLTGSKELREGVISPPVSPASQMATLVNLPLESLLDLLAVRLSGPKARGQKLKLAFLLNDTMEQSYVAIENGVLVHEEIPAPGLVDATISLSRTNFLATIFAGQALAPKLASGAVRIEGDASALSRLAAWLDPPNPTFPIVTR